MSNHSNRRFTGAFSGLLLLTVYATTLHAAAPTGWYMAGNKRAVYESGIDPLAVYNNRPSAYLKSTQPVVYGYGTLMQDFRADHYRGKRVRFSAFVRTDDAKDWAGLWMRVDSGRKRLALENMHDRPLKGTTSWQRIAIVLDVPQDATGIFFGVQLSGSGTVWLNDARFDIVGPTVLPADGDVIQTLDEPTNLDFEK